MSESKVEMEDNVEALGFGWLKTTVQEEGGAKTLDKAKPLPRVNLGRLGFSMMNLVQQMRSYIKKKQMQFLFCLNKGCVNYLIWVCFIFQMPLKKI